MRICLTRLEYSESGVFGVITGDHTIICLCAENPNLYIPIGTYPVSIYHSPVHGKVLLLTGIDNRTMIEIHPGNYPAKDSRGCLLPGTALLKNKQGQNVAVSGSRAAMAILLEHNPESIDII